LLYVVCHYLCSGMRIWKVAKTTYINFIDCTHNLTSQNVNRYDGEEAIQTDSLETICPTRWLTRLSAVVLHIAIASPILELRIAKKIIARLINEIILLRSEIPSGMCAKLRTAAASNNRDHASQSLLLVLARAMHTYFCSNKQMNKLFW